MNALFTNVRSLISTRLSVLLICVFIFASVSRGVSGVIWTNQGSIPVTQDLWGVKYLTSQKIIAVGTGGTIIRSTDDGVTWTSLWSQSATNFWAVSFPDSMHGVVVGDSGIVLTTTDGGTSWTKIIVNPSASFYSVSFTDPNTGTVVGDSGRIYRTTNGTTFTAQTSGTIDELNGVKFFDTNHGSIASSDSGIYTTTNGGASWLRDTNSGIA